MQAPHGGDPIGQFALALGAGVAGQLFAQRLRIPAIVPLLALGVLLGPDLLGWVDPRALGAGLLAIVELGVAVILFEGGMNLDLRRLRREGRAIRRLVSVGAGVTTLGAALAARAVMGWSWELALLFGTLVIVTGPTVIGPLLRNVRVSSRVATVLEGEGILIDPIGAIVVAVALQVVIGAHASALGGLAGRLALGTAVGIAGGLGLRALLRARHIVPAGLEVLVTLSGALLLFAGCNALVSQTGILAVTLAGVVVGDAPRHAGRELRAFQEHLTLGLIGVLFVLLAADVRLREVAALGGPGLATVAALILLVRPVNVLVSTWGTELERREKAFLAWIAPRGIVAAAVASLLATSMQQEGIDGGRELRALVFLTIAVTVLLQGATADRVARWLGVRRPDRDASAILGANPLALALADTLRRCGRRVVLLDSSPPHCRAAEEAGFAVVYGNALEERTLARARLEQASLAIGATPNEEANMLFLREAQESFGVPETFVAVRGASRLSGELLLRHASRVLFGGACDVDRWSARLRHGAARVQRFEFAPVEGAAGEPGNGEPWLILAVERAGTAVPMHDQLQAQPGDAAWVLIHEPDAELAQAALARRGWTPANG
jgi:NhaP-type Na+/H+ or K+/H+ antiporter